MTGLIEGVVSRALSATITTNTTEEIRTDAGFGVPKFAVVDLYLRSTRASLDTANSLVKVGLGHTRVFVAGIIWGSTSFAAARRTTIQSYTDLGFSGITQVSVNGMDSVVATVDLTLVTDGIDVTFSGSDVSSGAAEGYCVVRMYTGRGVLNAAVVNQVSDTTASTGLTWQPNALLAMTADAASSNSRTLSFGACDYNLNQASYGVVSADTLSAFATVSSNTKALHSIAYNTTFREEVSWAVTAFTSTGWTNTVSSEVYASTQNILVLAIELADPTEFEVGIATDTNSLSSTVELSNLYSNLNWETVRGCVVNSISQIAGSAYLGVSLVSISAGVNTGLSWTGLSGGTDRYQLKEPTGGASVSILEDGSDVNTWTSTANAADTKVSYARTAGTAVSEGCVYLSWGFVNTPRFNILIGEDYPSVVVVGTDLPVGAYVGNDEISNYV